MSSKKDQFQRRPATKNGQGNYATEDFLEHRAGLDQIHPTRTEGRRHLRGTSHPGNHDAAGFGPRCGCGHGGGSPRNVEKGCQALGVQRVSRGDGPGLGGRIACAAVVADAEMPLQNPDSSARVPARRRPRVRDSSNGYVPCVDSPSLPPHTPPHSPHTSTLHTPTSHSTPLPTPLHTPHSHLTLHPTPHTPSTLHTPTSHSTPLTTPLHTPTSPPSTLHPLPHTPPHPPPTPLHTPHHHLTPHSTPPHHPTFHPPLTPTNE